MALKLFGGGKTGPGVEKGGPKKKPFFLFWEIYGNKFWKFFQVNLIFTLFSLPIVTFGPAYAAMTQVMRKFVIGEPIFIFDEFRTAFKKNWKQSLPVGIFDVIMIVVLIFNSSFYLDAIEGGDELGNKLLLACSIAVTFILFMVHFYIYPQIVALELRLPQIIKNSFILMIAGVKNSFAGLFASAVPISLIVLFFPYSLLLLPLIPAAWVCFITTFCAYPVIRKYIIDPYYESRGEKNPEYARYETEGEAVFEDMGGKEAPTDIKPDRNAGSKKKSGNVRVKGKVIK